MIEIIVEKLEEDEMIRIDPHNNDIPYDWKRIDN